MSELCVWFNLPYFRWGHSFFLSGNYSFFYCTVPDHRFHMIAFVCISQCCVLVTPYLLWCDTLYMKSLFWMTIIHHTSATKHRFTGVYSKIVCSDCSRQALRCVGVYVPGTGTVFRIFLNPSLKSRHGTFFLYCHVITFPSVDWWKRKKVLSHDSLSSL